LKMGNPTNILDLPLEILDRILDELSFKDKLKLAQADQDLQSAFAYHCRNEYKKISSRTLSLENWSDFLMLAEIPNSEICRCVEAYNILEMLEIDVDESFSDVINLTLKWI
ncbi:hypothetical protein M5D96_005778, partial [Drosophila gunungcola]